jgi:hypothetical protein
MKFYKAAKINGFDFHTGNSINYRESIGKSVTPKMIELKDFQLCTKSVIHACRNPLDLFKYVSIPLSLYVVEGTPKVEDESKVGFTKLKIIKEIPEIEFDKLFGFKYSETRKPFDLRTIEPIWNKETLKLLKKWDSVWDSVWGSVWGSVRDSVWGSVWGSVRDSVRGSVRGSVWDSVRDSVRGSVRGSMWDSMWGSVRDSVRGSMWDSEYAYLGTLFPNIKQWNYLGKKVKKYPFQSSVELNKLGLFPVYSSYNKKWFVFGGKKMEIIWSGNLG